MKENLKSSINNFFAREPSLEQKSWNIINQFYHMVLTKMEKDNISRADLARKLGKSRASISQMFNKTPNLTIRKMVEISDAVGLEFSLIPVKSKKDQISRTSSLPEYSQRKTPRMEVNEKRNDE